LDPCAQTAGLATYDTPQALSVINQLYQELRISQNLFQPSMKLSCKIRKGSRVIRRYDSSWRCPGLWDDKLRREIPTVEAAP